MPLPSVSGERPGCREVEELRARVLERYVSVHAFCRAHPGLKRATVYLVLSGRYPGRVGGQAAKIRAALAGPAENKEGLPAPGMMRPTRADVAETLQRIRCAHCRRLDRRDCTACRDQTEREGKELFTRLFQGE